MGRLETERAWVKKQIDGRQTAYTDAFLRKGVEGGSTVGFVDPNPPTDAILPPCAVGFAVTANEAPQSPTENP